MSFTPFVRRLRQQPGVQLNPILQAAEADFGGDADQVVALAARLTRGRIDRAFLVNAANLERMTGGFEPTRANALNEAKLQMSEALKNGAASVLVSRLVPAAAEKRYAGVTIGGGGGGSTTTGEEWWFSTTPPQYYDFRSPDTDLITTNDMMVARNFSLYGRMVTRDQSGLYISHTVLSNELGPNWVSAFENTENYIFTPVDLSIGHWSVSLPAAQSGGFSIYARSNHDWLVSYGYGDLGNGIVIDKMYGNPPYYWWYEFNSETSLYERVWAQY
jgi:hypothetical protein